ncbi:MAG: DUF2384 domain-containing protein [Endozoicomonadaceae bacterium]|nr:DUF2384 domain-containing protein [Endozoicomonadaceae bacterium]
MNLATYKPTQQLESFWVTIGIPSRGAKLHSALHKGLPYEVYNKLANVAGLDKKTLAQSTIIAPATLQRRAKSGTFTTEESDKLYRFASVYKAALDLFGGNIESARQWIQQPVLGLGNKRPIDMLQTSAEVDSVINIIGRLEHGIPT